MSSSESQSVAVSVLVPVLNEAAGIREAVAAMQAQRLRTGVVELIFADGRSSDDTRAQLQDIASHDPRVRVFDNPARGTASGLNVCLREARGEYVARMDAHTLYPPDYLQRGIDRLAQGDAAWVAGPQLPEGRRAISRTVAAVLQGWIGRGGSRKWSEGAQEYELDTGVFCGVWRRSDMLDQVGFDEGWPRNQDSELAARFLRAGERIVCVPAMAARYQPRDSLRGLWRQYEGYGMYRARTALRHPASLRRSAVLPPVVVLDLGLAALGPARVLRRFARAGLGLYLGVLGLAAAQLLRRGKPLEAALAPIVLLDMHLAHGVGFLAGARRWGVPWLALARVAGLRDDPRDEQPYVGPIDAPSLNGAGAGQS